MAKNVTSNDPNLVGKLVYQAYVPQQPGKIVEDLGYPMTPAKRRSSFKNVKVKWLNGKTTTESVAILNDFEALVDDHKRKYEKFSAKAEQLKSL